MNKETKIYRYGLTNWQLHEFESISMPIGAKIVHVGHQLGEIMIWAEVDPSAELYNYLFAVIPTGGVLPPSLVHLGTVQMNISLTEFVWHVYGNKELKRSSSSTRFSDREMFIKDNRRPNPTDPFVRLIKDPISAEKHSSCWRRLFNFFNYRS